MSKEYYAGIGSRKSPKFICNLFTAIATELSNGNFILRSGGADGADLAFETGAGLNKQIWLPWLKFNGSTSNLVFDKLSYSILEDVLSEDHISKLSDAAKRLHCRNVHQILGNYQNGEPLSRFVLCWTPDADDKSGGTATAIKIAKKFHIPVYNFGSCTTEEQALHYWHRVKILENIS